MNVKLTGGLGNQLFSYAFGFSVAKARETKVTFDKSGYDEETLRHYELDAYDLPIEFEKQTGPVFEERDAFFDLDVYTTLDTNFRGYWQTERYFDAELVRKLFANPKWPPSPECLRFARWKIQDAENSCFIGVRRADYLWPERINYHGVLPIEYYREAIWRMPFGTRFFVFTDDIPWATENLCPLAKIVDVNGPNEKAWDIWLMSLCKHAIIANSTFHWWGAWLGADKSGGTVIAPKKWFCANIPNEIVPKRWVQI